jgi:hypothetical protein
MQKMKDLKIKDFKMQKKLAKSAAVCRASTFFNHQ